MEASLVEFGQISRAQFKHQSDLLKNRMKGARLNSAGRVKILA
jgi:hypothetical protein